MTRPTRQIQAVLAVLLVAVFLFLHSSWSDLERDRARPQGADRRPSELDGKQKEEGPQLAEQRPLNATKDWNQVVLDGVAPSSKEPTQATSSKHVKDRPTKATSTRYPPPATSSAARAIPHPDPSKITPKYDRVVVVGRLEREDTGWVQAKLPDWEHAVYVVDNPTSGRLHTIMNKGREAMPYLTYLVEHYDKLPATIVFLHAHRAGFPMAWHNEGHDYDAVEMVRTLNIDFVQRNGYANLRCIDIPGCPDEVQPFRNPPEDHRTTEHAMPDAWRQLFNNTNVPAQIGVACCGQFAVSRNQVLKRPLSDYQRYLDWLVRTPLDDDTSGRVFEYLWHVIFGQEPVYCPPLDQCYCDVYRRC